MFNISVLVSFLFFLVLAACSKTESSKSVNLSKEARAAAVALTASNNSLCSKIHPFYWELGNKMEALASGVTGDGSIRSDTSYGIASASKWIFGAYLVESRAGILSSMDIRTLTMSAGYTSFGNFSCISSSTVSDCHMAGTNANYTDSNDGSFYYGGGHYQKWAVDNGLGALSELSLGLELQSKLGSDLMFTFNSPQLAGGMASSAEQYALFLRKILSKDLLIGHELGANPVCTSSVNCPSSVSSPFGDKDFLYSYGHWVELGGSDGDGSFSSPGLFGFYPWINAEKTLYGIISRYELPALGSSDIGSGEASQLCGSLLRKAYNSGIAQ